HADVNRKIHHISKLRQIFSPFNRPTKLSISDSLVSLLDGSGTSPLPGDQEVGYDAGSLMLRAALIGFGSSGKSTLFQLMTSAKETGRSAHGKGDVSIAISKVPDTRLDRLTAMYNPRKRVPATVEFTDLAMPAGPGGGGGARGGRWRP